jgi:hypothetical protein
MALDWAAGLKKANDVYPPIVLLYAGAKSGKTSLAGEFPAPFYVRTGEGERPPAGVEMMSFGVSESYGDVVDQMDWMLSEEHDRKTFVLDAADGLEIHIRNEACARNGWKDIEEPGFGKGYAAEATIWREFIAKALKLKLAGYFVVIISHVKAKTVPGVTTDSYPRYMPNLRDEAVGIIVDASDLIGFLHQRVSIVKEEAGFKKTNKRGAGGGDIVIAVQERPGFIAGNRYDIPEAVIPFKRGEGFDAIAKYLPAELWAEGGANSAKAA